MKAALIKAKEELKADGWNHICSIMGGAGLRYGSVFTKDGMKFYLNKDTLMPSLTGPEMASACAPLFN